MSQLQEKQEQQAPDTASVKSLATGKPAEASVWEHIAAFSAYALLSVAVTWPVVLYFTTQGLGEMYFDRVQNTWNLWWVKMALLDRHTNPFHTDLLLYPQGADLYFHTLNLPSTLLSLPVQLAFNPIAAYNFSMLLALTLSGYAGFRLVRYLTGSRGGALIGGVIYGFNSLVLFQLRGHVQIISLQWMALCIEFYLRAWDTHRARHALLAGLFFSLALLTVGYYEVLLVIFFGVHLLWALIAARGAPAARLLSVAGRAGYIALWAGLAAVPILGPYLIGAAYSLNKGQVVIPDVSDPAHTIAESSDILSFIVPNRDHWLLGIHMPWWQGIDPALHERTYLGVIILGLAIAGLWIRRHEAATWLWAALAILGVALALGPVLQFNHRELGPGPLALLANVPPFNLLRGPERFAYLTYLGLAVLSGWGVRFWWPRGHPVAQRAPRFWIGTMANPKSKIEGAAVIAALLLLDLPLHVRYTEPMEVPPSLAALGRDPRPGALLELPFTQHGWIDAPRMLYQMAHGRPITSGYLSRPVVDPYAQACMPLQAFADYERLTAPDIISPTAAMQLPAILRDSGVGFVAIYKQGFVQPAYMSALPPDRLARYTSLAEQLADPAYEDDIAKVYRVRPSDSLESVYLQLGPDWHQVEESYGQPFRWMNGAQADACVFSPSSHTGSLTFQAASFGTTRHLQVWVGDRQILTLPIPDDGALHEITTPPVQWPSGAQKVRLVSQEASTSPQSIGQGTDQRQLSLGFAGIRVGSEAP